MFPLQFSEICPFESPEILHHASIKTFFAVYRSSLKTYMSLLSIFTIWDANWRIFKVNGNALLTDLKQKDKSKHVPQS